jgi:hypothetical protein
MTPPGVRRHLDQSLTLALQSRVGNLETVEHSPTDIGFQVWLDGGYADPAHFRWAPNKKLFLSQPPRPRSWTFCERRRHVHGELPLGS